MTTAMKGIGFQAVALAWLLSTTVVDGQSPTMAPSTSSAPSMAPSTSSPPSIAPSTSSPPSMAPSTSPPPSVSHVPTGIPTVSVVPTQIPTVSVIPTLSSKPTVSFEPTNKPTVSLKPSSQPSVSLRPTVSNRPTMKPSVSLSPTPQPSAFPTQECYSNMDDLVAMIARGNGVFEKTYTLCPNTVFDIGERGPTGDCCIKGQSFLMVKSRNIIQCGANGESSNNCILRGGPNQFIAGFGGFLEFRISGVLVKGLTFEGFTRSAVTMTSEGSVRFEDCIFRRASASSPVISIYVPSTPGNGNSFPNPPGDDVAILQFQNCLFEGFVQSVGKGGIETEGIVTALSSNNVLIFESCIFRHNFFPGLDKNPMGYAIQTGGSALEIRNTCFYNNTFVGWAPVRAFDNGAVTQADNFIDDQTKTTTCPFIAFSTSKAPDRLQDVDCVDAALNGTCPLNNYSRPVVNPTSSASTSQAILSLAMIVSTLFWLGF